MVTAPDKILVSRDPGETRCALLAGERVLEVFYACDGEALPGTVLAGRVVRAGSGGRFINIGDSVPGVLRGKADVAEGQTVAVRLMVPARAGKGAEVKIADDVAIPDGVAVPGVLAPAPDMALAWWNRYRASITNVTCASVAEQQRVRTLLGEAPVAAQADGTDMFTDYGVDGAIEAALEPSIALACGGTATIETTAGATVIDVDAGSADPAVANAEAVEAVAAALRLRNIGGHILIDVIPPRGRRNAVRAAARNLADRLAQLTGDDPCGIEIAGVTPLGMIELTRRRIGLSLVEQLSAGKRRDMTLALAALRRAVRAVREARAVRVEIDANADVAALLKGPLRAALDEAASTAHAEISVRVRPGDVINVTAV